MYVCAPCVYCVCAVQKRVLDPLDLELWVAVNSNVDAGSQTQVLCKNNCSQALSRLFSPLCNSVLDKTLSGNKAI